MSGRTDVGKPRKLCFLLICDEWSPTQGGITTFNRSLAIALAAEGHRTLCLVRSASPKERDDASQRGVELLVAVRTPRGGELHVLPREVVQADPDVVVGHDLVTGSIAWTYAKRYLPGSKLVHVVHTAYSQNEPYKRPDEAWPRTAEYERQMREIAADADVVAAVGPLLTRRTEAVVGDGFGDGRVVRLDPGMTTPDEVPLRRRRVPANRTVLMLARARHLEPKGLDIAAQAIARMIVPGSAPQPELLIRGAPEGQCDSLRETLVNQFEIARDRVDVRPFTGDPNEIAHDLRRAALCIMPSRVEGFGLAGLDAIGLGTPVLVSGKSGLAETLRQHLGPGAEPMIVDVTDNGDDVTRWRHAIQRVLANLPAEFTYIDEVREKLRQVLTWRRAVHTLTTSLGSARPDEAA